jgi:hypothetical protein
MKFPTAKKVEELAFFNGMMMGTVPGVTFKVEPWNPNGGAKAKLETAWFRITGIPQEKRTERRVSMVASLVGLPLEVDKANLKRWDYVRVKIGCKDITKVPAVVEGLLDMHFYDFSFQREVQVEGSNNPGWNTWTRSSGGNDNPSPKKHKKSGGISFQDGSNDNHDAGAGTSAQPAGRQHCTGGGKSVQGACDGQILQESQVQDRTGEKTTEDDMLVDKDEEKENLSSQDSDDSIAFDELISPGGHWNFGTFQKGEIRNIFRLQLNETNSVAFNEYGSNLFKSKLDPLTVFEAKVAMSMGKDEAEGGLDVSGKGMDKIDEEMTVGGDPERKQLEVLSQLGGSQDAPEIDLSSQDQSQPELKLGDVNKERTTSDTTPVTIERDGAPAGEVMGLKGGDANEVGRAQISPDWDQLEEGLEEETNTEKGNVTHDEAEDGADIWREAQGAQEGVA